MSHTPEELEAAREAAQAAVDTATSWDYSASDAKIADKLAFLRQLDADAQDGAQE